MSDFNLHDRRVMRTHNALWGALRMLLQEKSWDDINIKCICDRADVARSSFYAHFHSKSDLLDFGFADVLQDLIAQVRSPNLNRKGFETINWLVDHVTENPGFFMKIARLGSDAFLFSRFTLALENVLKEELMALGKTVPSDDIVFAMSGVFALLRRGMDNASIDAEHLKNVLNLNAFKILSD